MTLRNQKSVVWPPAGLSDALDSSEEDFPGSLALCQNLIPAQNNRKMMVARPAATILTSLPDFGGGPVTCMIAVGNVIYGMYASLQFSGKDRPFAYNLATNTFSTISGMTSGNLPASQSTTGDWTPPTAENVATRVLFTHPGFPGGTTTAPSYTVFSANTSSGSNQLTGIFFPFLAVGMQLYSSNIPNGTTITALSNPTVYTTGTGTGGNNFFTVGSAAGIVIGDAVAGPQIPLYTTVTNIAGTTVTISANLAANLSGTVAFSGTQATMSANATGTATQTNISAISSPPGQKFGWLDLSNFSTSILANTINAQPILTGAPQIAGIQPGMTATGSGFAAGTVVLATANVVFTTNCAFSSASATVTFNQQFAIGFPAVGQSVSGAAAIPVGTTVVAVAIASGIVTVTLSQNTTAGGPAVLTFTGAIIILSANNTGASTTGAAITIAGGTASAPLWGSGDTNIIGLAGIPVFVRQLAGSAAFGVNTTNPPTSAVVFSDPSVPCQVSNANQVITFANAVPATAAKGLPLENQLGGIIQSLIVFQGASNIQQITGSVALGNITLNTSQLATGTFAPNSVASTPKGLIFASPFGLRVIDFDGRVTDPIGARGKGAVIPFQNAVNATRINGSFNENTYRVTISWQPPPTLQNIWGSATRTDEFWLHLDIGTFTGPHTSAMDLSAPWISLETFVCAPTFGRGGLYVSDPDQAQNSTYIENGAALTWTLRTTLLPDDESLYANGLVESDIFASMTASTQWLASFIDDQNQTLAQAYVWLGPNITQSKLPIYWNKAIAFRQGSVLLTGNSEQQTLIGAIGLRYQKLKYQITFRPVKEFVLGQSVLGGPDVLGP